MTPSVNNNPAAGEPATRSAGATKRDSPADEADFGFIRVSVEEKQALVDDVFEKVAGRYDLMNDFMSAGVHRIWKDILVTKTGISAKRPFRHIDVAGGSGDVAFRIADRGGPKTHVTVADINNEMLEVGRARASKRKIPGRIEFVEANAEDLPFPDSTFDAYTIAFGIRNVPRRNLALSEAWRVLKRSGRFLCLEFSTVDVPLLDTLYESYSFTAIPAIGKIVTGDGHPYRYLVESIAKFPDAENFCNELSNAGFRRTGFTRLSGGIVAIHSGWKL